MPLFDPIPRQQRPIVDRLHQIRRRRLEIQTEHHALDMEDAALLDEQDARLDEFQAARKAALGR